MIASDARFAPLHPVLTDGGFDALAFVPGANFRRVFGRDFHLMERPLVIIVPREGAPVAIVPALEMAAFEKLAFPGEVFSWRDEDGYRAAFAEAGNVLSHLAENARFGLEAQRMRVFEQMALAAVFPGAEFIDAHADISSIRLLKSAEEIALLKRAIGISERALEATLQKLRIGQSETDIAAILLGEMFANGADGVAFEPIVAAGANSAEPHAVPRADYAIRAGDSLLIDFGASWRGYNADITRTFFVGEVSDRDRAFYETVEEANHNGRAAAKPGVTAHAVDDAVQQTLERSNFAEFARHKTGHGLGLDVHESPHIMRGNRQELTAGMVFTVEPGLYRGGECGVRIEDDVAVTTDGIECLTAFSRELRIVG